MVAYDSPSAYTVYRSGVEYTDTVHRDDARREADALGPGAYVRDENGTVVYTVPGEADPDLAKLEGLHAQIVRDAHRAKRFFSTAQDPDDVYEWQRAEERLVKARAEWRTVIERIRERIA